MGCVCNRFMTPSTANKNRRYLSGERFILTGAVVVAIILAICLVFGDMEDGNQREYYDARTGSLDLEYLIPRALLFFSVSASVTVGLTLLALFGTRLLDGIRQKRHGMSEKNK